MRVFFYGTLMDEAVRRAVLGATARRLSIVPATLAGWRRVHVRGRDYPVVVPAAGRTVDGALADGIDAAGIRRLDAFETAEYRRRMLEVRTEAGETRPAWVYVAVDAAVATAMPWDFEVWRRRHQAGFLRRLTAGDGP